MQSWPAPAVPALPGRDRSCGCTTAPTVRSGRSQPGETATMYVCGITPYDATHLGHAATYLTFDLVHRVWLDAGHEVHYVQNVTDVDDPLFERAAPRRHGLARARRPRDRAVPRGHGGAAGAAAARLRRRDRGHRRGHRGGREDAGLRRGLRRRRRRVPRRVLPRRRHPAVRLRVGLRPRHHDAAVRRARWRPGPCGQRRRARRAAVAGARDPANRVGRRRSVPAGRAGTSNARRSR